MVANGAEGEPGTFKDRFLVRHNPYHLVEGMLLAAWVVGARRTFIALKRSFSREAVAVANAVEEIEAVGWLPDIGVELVRGPDEYLLGPGVRRKLGDAACDYRGQPRCSPHHRHQIRPNKPPSCTTGARGGTRDNGHVRVRGPAPRSAPTHPNTAGSFAAWDPAVGCRSGRRCLMLGIGERR